ncbi:Uma2 family endonuclease [Streptomyces sp. NBC_01142]|uniref:Uma2 family endonuclease n=1 Tax=Streptomyces sp. NBC_01142 TaxID=2975865 RepID=UPI0022539D1F|nr:Uma2 family endonuclease [Streptomyces sp. NBC_01142]MCX4823978.1 Uma2 family endonuclease [Streptomyces sp. NBC_01142]
MTPSTAKPLPDQLHGAIIMWLLRQCMHQRPELALYPGQGLTIKTYREGRTRADGALAPLDHFVKQPGEWADPDGVLMVVEVTSPHSGDDSRCDTEKREAYAAAGIPVFLLVDRDKETLTVYSDPENGVYRHNPEHSYGATVRIPHPVAVTLETERLKGYAH